MNVRGPIRQFAALCVLNLVATLATGIETDLARQFNAARENGITIVNARGAVDATGRPNQSARSWTTNVLPGLVPKGATRDLGLTNGKTPPSVIVIFVHGYGTPAEAALEDSNALWRHIKESNSALRKTAKGLPENSAIAFCAFLWKGDFGALSFGKSRQSADSTAPVFADFLQTVMREANGARIVVITHSLGTQVVLEALRSLRSSYDHPIIDDLVLIQGAVPFYSLYHWTAKISWLNPSTAVARPDVVSECSGRYASAIQLASHLIFTQSARDRVLSRAYYLYNELINAPAALCDLPISNGPNDLVVALGSPITAGDRAELIEPPRTPMTPQPGTTSPRVLRITPPQNSLLLSFTKMRIEHPDATALSIAAYEDTSTDIVGLAFPGHSVVFQSNGNKIVDELWRRVMLAASK